MSDDGRIPIGNRLAMAALLSSGGWVMLSYGVSATRIILASVFTLMWFGAVAFGVWNERHEVKR